MRHKYLEKNSEQKNSGESKKEKKSRRIFKGWCLKKLHLASFMLAKIWKVRKKSSSSK